MIEIREARVTDAKQCSQILRSSIRDLCVADHNNDEQLVSQWISNKTEENLEQWIQAKNTKFFVAAYGNELGGVGAISLPDEIALNYVSPKFRFQGNKPSHASSP